MGVGLSKNRYLVDSDPAIESSQLTDKDDTAGTTTKNSLFSKKEKTDNYEMAYEYFKSYKDYLDDQYKDYDDYVDYDMVEESADADGDTNQYNAGPTVGASSAATASATGGSAKSEGEALQIQMSGLKVLLKQISLRQMENTFMNMIHIQNIFTSIV